MLCPAASKWRATTVIFGSPPRDVLAGNSQPGIPNPSHETASFESNWEGYYG